MNNTTLFIITLVSTALTTFFLRAAPTLIPRKWLTHPFLQALNRFLPLCVMVALVLSTFTTLDEPLYRSALAQLLALLLVLLSYIRFKNVFLSMIIGVGGLNGLLFLFNL
ncbi:MAG TPA: AzlD domain-containing protein [Paenalcaligenes sp.]|nr:AzlD domain-containing protein [Paenalcaligenes sp.]